MKRLMLLFFVLLVGCSSGNKDYVRQHAEERWREIGFEIVGYEGFQWGFWGFGSHGGAKVWYNLKKIPDNGVTYTGYLVRWGDELQIYGPAAIDAIRVS